MSQVIQETLPLERYGLITITDVVVNPGLETAKIFISALNHPRDLVTVLNKKAGQLSKKLHSKVSMRKIPKITFEYDISNERVERFEELMRDQQ